MSPDRFTSVLVAVDGSDGSRRALEAALSFCHAAGAKLTVLATQGSLPKYAASIGEVEDAQRIKDRLSSSLLDEAQVMASYAGVEVATDVVAGPAAKAITRYAKSYGHDLIVLAERRRFLHGCVLRSTADRVARRAPCPVMVVR